MMRSRRPTLRRFDLRSIVVGLGAILGGCAAEAPQRPATPPLQPVIGEEQRAIARRAFFFVEVYRFESGGHRYSLANASDMRQLDSYAELVFIDGRLACARERPSATLADLDSDLTRWESVGEPGGLEHLAVRLRDACRQATEATAALPPPIDKELNDGQDDGNGSVERPATVPTDSQVAAAVLTDVLPLASYNPQLLIIAPLVLLAIGISNVVQNGTEARSVENDARWRAANTVEDLMRLLGEPTVEFALPEVGTRVRAYRLDDVHCYYVGISDGRAIWFHNQYPWLRMLAEQAAAQQGVDR